MQCVLITLALLIGTAEAGPPFARSPSSSSKLQSFTKLMEMKEAANPPPHPVELKKEKARTGTGTPLGKMTPAAKMQPKREAPPAGAAKLPHVGVLSVGRGTVGPTVCALCPPCIIRPSHFFLSFSLSVPSAQLPPRKTNKQRRAP